MSIREKKLARIALFAYAQQTQPDPVLYLQNQLHQYTPAHKQHFLLSHAYSNGAKEAKRKQSSRIPAQFKEYLADPMPYDIALAHFFVLSNVTLPDTVWEELPELAYHVSNVYTKYGAKSSNLDNIFASPARDMLDVPIDKTIDREQNRFYKECIEPLNTGLPPIHIVKHLLGVESAEIYRSTLESLEDCPDNDVGIHDALETGANRKWNTIQCESKMRALNKIHEFKLKSSVYC